jgi:hypothetical protein
MWTIGLLADAPAFAPTISAPRYLGPAQACDHQVIPAGWLGKDDVLGRRARAPACVTDSALTVWSWARRALVHAAEPSSRVVLCAARNEQAERTRGHVDADLRMGRPLLAVELRGERRASFGLEDLELHGRPA